MRPAVVVLLAGIGVIGSFVPASRASVFSLEIPPDARSEGMGRSWVVMDRGPSSAWGNVGGMAFTRGWQLSVSRAELVEGLAYDGTLHGVSALKGLYAAGRNLTVGLNATRVDLTHGDISNSPKSQSETTIGVAGAIRLTRHVGIGLAVKRVGVHRPDDAPGSSETPSDVNDVGPAYDAGVLGLLPFALGRNSRATLNLLGGLTIRNMGPGLEIGYREPTTLSLPHEYVLGLGCEFESGSERGFAAPGLARLDSPFLSISASMSIRHGAELTGYEQSPDETHMSAGGELSLRRALFVRGGYVGDRHVGRGWTWGTGIAVRNVVGFDVARVPAFVHDPMTRVSVWVRVPRSHTVSG